MVDRPSMDEYGSFSMKWMARAALRGATRNGLLIGVDNLLDAIFEVATADEDEEYNLLDFVDILVQSALTGQYIEAYDPDEHPEGAPQMPVSESYIDAEVEKFAEVLGLREGQEESNEVQLTLSPETIQALAHALSPLLKNQDEE